MPRSKSTPTFFLTRFMIGHHFASGVQLKGATSQRLLLIGVTQVVSPRYVGVSSGRGLRSEADSRSRGESEDATRGECARVYACRKIDERALRTSRLNYADDAGRRRDEPDLKNNGEETHTQTRTGGTRGPTRWTLRLSGSTHAKGRMNGL